MNSPGCNVSANELLLKIPIDLIIEIFSRLPLKSIARCRCVSKPWTSVLRGPDFTELYLTKSLARPQLLFAFRKDDKKEVIFFSTPQPQNLDEGSSPIVVNVNHHVSFPFERVYDISNPINGFVCIKDETMLEGRINSELVLVICNPSTRQSFSLPELKIRMRTDLRSFLGYDPIEKQHKVLAMIKHDDELVKHQVLTLRGGSGNLTWRKSECGIPHFSPNPDSICIGGVLYYAARASHGGFMIVCFDVRSEKYSFVKYMERQMYFGTLINFQGKLASLVVYPEPFIISGRSTEFEMWILQDPEKHKWSPRLFKLPPTWKDVVAGEELLLSGVTATNEFVLYPNSSSEPFHVYYYNFIKGTITKVEIQGMEAYERGSIGGVFPNHVANVKLV